MGAAEHGAQAVDVTCVHLRVGTCRCSLLLCEICHHACGDEGGDSSTYIRDSELGFVFAKRVPEKKISGPNLGVRVLLCAAKSMRQDWATVKMWGGGCSVLQLIALYQKSYLDPQKTLDSTSLDMTRLFADVFWRELS